MFQQQIYVSNYNGYACTLQWFLAQMTPGQSPRYEIWHLDISHPRIDATRTVAMHPRICATQFFSNNLRRNYFFLCLKNLVKGKKKQDQDIYYLNIFFNANHHTSLRITSHFEMPSFHELPYQLISYCWLQTGSCTQY